MNKQIRLLVDIYGFKKGCVINCDRVSKILAFFTFKREKYCLLMGEDCELVGEEIMKCKKHPRYKAIRKPRSDCETCHRIYNDKHKGK